MNKMIAWHFLYPLSLTQRKWSKENSRREKFPAVPSAHCAKNFKLALVAARASDMKFFTLRSRGTATEIFQCDTNALLEASFASAKVGPRAAGGGQVVWTVPPQRNGRGRDRRASAFLCLLSFLAVRKESREICQRSGRRRLEKECKAAL